jgi:SAM-dependent methyltransferase
MKEKVKKFLKKLNSYRRDKYNGLNLPLFRTNEGLNDNENYLKSAVEQLDHLKLLNLIDNSSIILDFGCGQGRFVNGLEYSNTTVGNYYGIDTDLSSINWCKRFISVYDAKYHFQHLAAYNARYNTSVKNLQKLPFSENQFDLIFLNSVFSHMLEDDLKFYLNEFHKILKQDGSIYLTAFIEENVPDIEENPTNYINPSIGALHRVRYELNHFKELIENEGFRVDHFFHQHIKRAKQSVVILKKD